MAMSPLSGRFDDDDEYEPLTDEDREFIIAEEDSDRRYERGEYDHDES